MRMIASVRMLLVLLSLTTAVAAAGCEGNAIVAPAVDAGAGGATTAAANASYSIHGVWRYVEETALTLPGEFALAMGVAPEGPVLHVACSSPQGVLSIVQTGQTFTGTLVHPSSSCTTRGGQAIPAPWPLPYEATIAGRLTGRALHIDQSDVVGPVQCPKSGTLTVEAGAVVELTTTGRCDLSSIPARPAVATNAATATRP
jgi:hypothetical protein